MIRLLGRGLRALGDMLLGTSDGGAFEMWMQAAAACGVENLVGARLSPLAIRRIDGVRWPLKVSLLPLLNSGASAHLTVEGLPDRLLLHHEGLGLRAAKRTGREDFQLGDPEFDSEFFVKGDPLVVRGVFDVATRRMAIAVFGRRPSVAAEILGKNTQAVGIAEGKLTARFEDTGFPHPPVTPAEWLAQALAIADRVARDPQEEHLASVVRSDPMTDVRLQAIELLREERPRHPDTIAALEAACADPDARIRFAAAMALGVSRAATTLLDLASDPELSDATSARAIEELRSRLPAEPAVSILDAALEDRRTETACACLETLSRSGPFAETIAEVVVAEGDSEVGLAAIRVLGRCGTASEVPLLRGVEARHPRNAPVAIAARATIAAIKGRITGDAGQLALAADDRGHLSVPEEGGHVSLPETAREDEDEGEPEGPKRE